MSSFRMSAHQLPVDENFASVLQKLCLLPGEVVAPLAPPAIIQPIPPNTNSIVQHPVQPNDHGAASVQPVTPDADVIVHSAQPVEYGAASVQPAPPDADVIVHSDQPVDRGAAAVQPGVTANVAVMVTSDSIWQSRFLQSLGIDCDALEQELLGAKELWAPRSAPELKYRGVDLKRTEMFLQRGQPGADELESFIVYRYPGWQHGSLQFYKPWHRLPLLTKALEKIESHLLFQGRAVSFNHLIVTMYEHEEDSIGFHADKSRDIRHNTPIVSLSLGGQHEVHLVSSNSKHIQVLSAGDVFVLGPRTNDEMKRAVVPIAEEQVIKRQNQNATRPRITLALRDIVTVMARDQVVPVRRSKRKSAAASAAATTNSQDDDESSSSKRPRSDPL